MLIALQLNLSQIFVPDYYLDYQLSHIVQAPNIQNGLNPMNKSRDMPMEALGIDHLPIASVPQHSRSKYPKWRKSD